LNILNGLTKLYLFRKALYRGYNYVYFRLIYMVFVKHRLSHYYYYFKKNGLKSFNICNAFVNIFIYVVLII